MTATIAQGPGANQAPLTTIPPDDQIDAPSVPEIPADASTLDAALTYAAAGLYVLPVKPGTKNPGSRVGTRWGDKSSRDPEMLAAWYAASSDSVALDLGRSGLVVVDVDHPELVPGWLLGELRASAAPYQSTRPDTPGRGHYVFRQPPARVIGNGLGGLAGMGLDIRGGGGVIMAQPSPHPDGGEYRWIRTGLIPLLSNVIADKLDDAGERDSAATDAEVRAFLAEYTGAQRPTLLSGWVKCFNDALARHDSRHEAMVAILCGAMEEAMAGFYPAAEADDTLRKLFVGAKTGIYGGKAPLRPVAANAEFDGILSWAVAQAKRHGPAEIRERVARKMPQSHLGMSQAAYWGHADAEPGPEAAPAEGVRPWGVVTGATFILDAPKDVPAIWGEGDNVLWPDGEALMIAGGQGLGKTTLAGLLVRGQLGLIPNVLGLAVSESDGPILYLAMDRPRQIARSLARQFAAAERDILERRLLIRPGPPEADLAKNPELLARMASDLGAAVVFVDSLKDAAIGLSDDEVGASYNRARQHVLHAGRQVCELHHVTKHGAEGISDIYGSTWLTSGCGGVILLTGQPGDPIVGFRHVKPAVAEVGPFRLSHDNARGLMSVESRVDLTEMAARCGVDGLTARAAAAALFDVDKPDRAQVEKARRKLNALVAEKRLQRFEGTTGGSKGGICTAWFLA